MPHADEYLNGNVEFRKSTNQLEIIPFDDDEDFKKVFFFLLFFFFFLLNCC